MSAFDHISKLRPITPDQATVQTVYIDLGNGNRHAMKMWDIIDMEDALRMFLALLDRDLRECGIFHKDGRLKSNLIQ